MSYWSRMIAAYETDLQVLEEARRAYLDASRFLLDRLHSGISNLDLSGHLSLELEEGSGGRESVVAEAPSLHVRCTKGDELPGIELSAWVASARGGPLGILRLGLALGALVPPLSAAAERWTKLAHENLPDDLAGEPYAADRHLDVGDRQWLRVHSISLSDRTEQEILGEALEVASSYLGGGFLVLDAIERATRPLFDAYAALCEQQVRLAENAAELGVPVVPPGGGRLGSWQGQDYLQIGQFWVGIDPAVMAVLVGAYPSEAKPIEDLARSVGRPVEQRYKYPSLVLLDEEELRSRSASEIIAGAFETWLSWKRGEVGMLGS